MCDYITHYFERDWATYFLKSDRIFCGFLRRKMTTVDSLSQNIYICLFLTLSNIWCWDASLSRQSSYMRTKLHFQMFMWSWESAQPWYTMLPSLVDKINLCPPQIGKKEEFLWLETLSKKIGGHEEHMKNIVFIFLFFL